MSSTTSETGGIGDLFDPYRWDEADTETAAFYHAESCPGFCDFACGGKWYERDDEKGIKLGFHGQKGWREVE